jgi:ankyrin repeat protein
MTGSGNTMTGNGEVQDHQLGWLLKNRDFDTIESLVDDMRARKLRYSTGEWCLRYAYDGLVGGQKDFNWEDTPAELLEALNAWAEAKPESATPLIARAQYELNLAWESRGGGWARDVTEEGWRGFREHLGKAWEYLRKAEAMAPADPQLYTIQVHASRGFSAGAPDSLLEAFKQVLSGERPAAPYREAFEKGVAVEPHYAPLYMGLIYTLAPRWYGSVGEVMAFAESSTESLEPPYDDILYALMASRVISLEGQREFLESYTFSWPRIRNGLEQRAALYTNNTWTDSRLAYFAAVYRDRQLAAQLFEDLGDNADEDALGGAKRMRQLRAWALENAPMPVQNAEFLEAVRSGTRWRVEAMLDEGASPNSEGAQGETALFAAVRLQEPELVALLLEQGADPNSVGWEGWPSLFQAVKFERIDLVRMLLEHGADPDKSPLDRLSCPLVAAAAHNRADIAALLVEHGADVNIQDKDGWTPLHASAQRGFADIVTLLLDNGADVHAVAGPGLTPLYSAVHHGQTECAELLLAHGSDPNKLQWGGQFRPLTGAAWRGHLDIVRLLLAREDVDLLATSGKGHNALMMAAAAGHLDIVKYLVEEHEFPLDLRSATGQTALGAAIEMEKPAVAGYLREHGAQE